MKKQAIIQLIAGALAGAALGWLGMKAGRSLDLAIPMHTSGQKLAGVAVILFSSWFALAFHELAHLVTGLVQGLRFHLYVAGFLGVRRSPETDRVQVYFNTDWQLFGGVAATMPRRESPDLTLRFARIVIAGPLGSLLLTVMGGWGGWALKDASAPAFQFAALFLLVSALVSFFLFLATTIPSRTGIFFTDRARFFRLISGGNTAAAERAMLELVAFAQSGKPFEQMDTNALELARQDPAYAPYAESYAFYHHLAAGRPEAALAAANRMIAALPEDMPAVFKAELWKELCFAAAFLKNDAEEANAWWQKLERYAAKRQDASTLRIRAALCRVNGDLEGAQDWANRARAALGKLQAPNGSRLLEERLLSEISAGSTPMATPQTAGV